MRYRGQAHELAVEMTGAAAARSGAADLRSRFERAHAERYGYADPDGEIELVNLRVAASRRGIPPAPPVTATGTAQARRSSRRARFGEEWIDAAVITGDLGAGEQVEGPASASWPRRRSSCRRDGPDPSTPPARSRWSGGE